MSIERFDDDVEVVSGRRTIVTALPLKRRARERLAELTAARVVDVRDPVDRADLVLTPPCSPQLVGLLKAKYEGARVVVVELDDWEFDIDLPGPVKRILQAGADAYVLADSLDDLARKIATRADGDHHEIAQATARELSASATIDDLIAAFLRESVEYSTRLRIDEGELRPD